MPNSRGKEDGKIRSHNAYEVKNQPLQIILTFDLTALKFMGLLTFFFFFFFRFKYSIQQ